MAKPHGLTVTHSGFSGSPFLTIARDAVGGHRGSECDPGGLELGRHGVGAKKGAIVTRTPVEAEPLREPSVCGAEIRGEIDVE